MLAAAALSAGPSAAASPPASAASATSPRDHGAIGDGQYRPLASRFASLAAAKAVFPFVTSLKQSDDWAGIQAAIDVAEGVAGRVVIPVGRFILSDSLRLPSQVTLEGESRCGSILDNQNWPLNAAQIVNKDPDAFLYVTIRNLTLHGGTHALAVHARKEVAGIVIEGVTAQLQSVANIEFSSLQTAVLRDCYLTHGKHGLSVLGFPCNSVHLINTRLGSHADASLRLRGADLVAVIGGSMEGGGVGGLATIDVETGRAYANAIAFRHVYFENTHEFLLRSRGARTLSFDGCKFSGTALGEPALKPYRFDCGADLIEFGGNHWDLPTNGPGRVLLSGRNDRLRCPGACWTAMAPGQVAVALPARHANATGPVAQLRFDSAPAALSLAPLARAVVEWLGRDASGKPATARHEVDLLLDTVAGERRAVLSGGYGEAPLTLTRDAAGRASLAVAPLRSATFQAESVRVRLVQDHAEPSLEVVPA